MNEGQNGPENLLDTTDCLEAVGVFRSWKNFLFILIILFMLVLQASFWLVNIGIVKPEQPVSYPAAVVAEDVKETEEIAKQATKKKAEIQKAAQQVATDANQSTKAIEQQDKPRKIFPFFTIKLTCVASVIRFLNFVLVPAAVLYCLTMLFVLKVSLLGRLGGINHIARAFFMSLVFVVLLLPWSAWRLLSEPIFTGVLFSSAELESRIFADKGITTTVFFYLRFVGYWVLAVLILVLSQIRSIRWAKATLRRLEVI